MVLVQRYYINYRMDAVDLSIAIGNVLGVLRWVGAVAAVAALVWAYLQLKQKKPFGIPLVAAIAGGAVAVCAHVSVKFQGEGVSMLFWLVAAWALLALVYYIYQREFFLAACACGMSALGLWFARTGAGGRLETVLVLVAIAVVTAAACWLKKTDGVLPGNLRFLGQGTSYTVPLITCAASLVAVVAGMILGGTVAYYLVFVMVAWLFALFVYYTVKLM